MQFTAASIVAIISFLSTASAFNAQTDSCRPSDATYKTKRPSELKSCLVSGAKTPWMTYDCGSIGKVVYDFEKNTLRLASGTLPTDGEFTIHAACFEKGKQVAHADLRMPTRANVVADHVFAGLNRKCNIGQVSAGAGTSNSPRLYIDAYVLNQQELAQCAKAPVRPIS